MTKRFKQTVAVDRLVEALKATGQWLAEFRGTRRSTANCRRALGIEQRSIHGKTWLRVNNIHDIRERLSTPR